MNNVKITIYVDTLSERQADLLRSTGFIGEGRHIYSKIYEINDSVNAVLIAGDLLFEIDIEPYRIEIDKIYFENVLDKATNVYYTSIC